MLFARWWPRPAGRAPSNLPFADLDAGPLRCPLLSAEALEAQAEHLTTLMGAARHPGASPLRSFKRVGRDLQVSHETIRAATRKGTLQSGEAEWLLDNYHIIAETARDLSVSMPTGYYRRLPKACHGAFAGQPCMLGLAADVVAHCDAGLDEASLDHYVNGIQRARTLTNAELWSLPTMLRLVLLENLRRLARQVVHRHNQQQQASRWAAARRDELCPELPRDHSAAFAVHVCGHFATCEAARNHLEAALAANGTPLAELRRVEQQRQAADQVSIGNSVTSLRLLGAIDWSKFVERHSVVERLLREEPSGAYSRQDQRTRERCRQVVEELADDQRDEAEVAKEALRLAREGAAGLESVTSYFLLGAGRSQLEAAIGYRPRGIARLRRWLTDRPLVGYFGALVGLIVGIIAVILTMATPSMGAALLFTLLLLLPVSEMAVQVIHQLIAALLPPRRLPRLDYSQGLAADCATFVVIPGLLNREADAANLVNRLEVHYHAARDPMFRFALLTDFADAQEQDRPEDARLLAAVMAGIRRLNERHAPGEPDRFFVFHRQRRWNPVEGHWMGWERKRGKLLEFNRLLHGATDTSYLHCSGSIANLPKTRFVITLDADTQLPLEAAQRLVATLAHPLNQPHFDVTGQRVVSGYAILQPRVSFTLAGAAQSAFARLFSASPGVDPYATACSDAYQDLFGAGNFTGKGIYDVEAFERAVGAVFPDNAILSHDLIESNYARCGLCTDTELFDHFPPRYLAFARREHRWIRGDWQLLPWLGRRVPRPQDGAVAWVPNPLPLLERWKILDNLRRSLLAPALVLLLLCGWLITPGHAWFWTTIVLVVCLWPTLLEAGAKLPVLWRSAPGGIASMFASLRNGLAQGLLKFSLLLEQSLLAGDAIGRTLYRLWFSRRRMLEWETAAAAERRVGNEPADFLHQLYPGLLLPLVLALFVGVAAPPALPAASLVLAAFAFAPLLAWRLSQPPRRRDPQFTPAQLQSLRLLARRTWAFFETHVTAEDNWLPPDNYQEWPKGMVAHRTSPTNIGFYLVSCLTAHDLGFITLTQLVERLEQTLATLERLPSHFGHVVNWIDTRTLQPLLPEYLSTVDSGNLLACLLVLQTGLEEAARQPQRVTRRNGVMDTLALAAACSRDGAKTGRLAESLAAMLRDLAQVPDDAPAGLEALRKTALHLRKVTADTAKAIPPPSEATYWLEAALPQVEAAIHNLQLDAAAEKQLAQRCRTLSERARRIARAMDFTVLFSSPRKLFSVGFNVTTGKLDTAHYDLLASEACLTSFLAIAIGQAPRRHWFQLGRPMTSTPGGPALVSWSGTMFEYLMPQLFLPTLAGSVLQEGSRAAVATQIDYARRMGSPWGISESAYAKTDAELNYQYQAFGVPELGLKRGLGKQLVVAPYASMLALTIDPVAVLHNFRKLEAAGALGRFGFYEAIDYSTNRLNPAASGQVVKCFMSHHQGMGLAALGNLLQDRAVVRRLAQHPEVQATELLLQEPMPQQAPVAETSAEEITDVPAATTETPLLTRRLTTPHTNQPRVHLLGSAGLQLVISNSGSNRSSRDKLDLVRWREDATRDGGGQFFYFRDVHTGRTWSGGYQPLRQEADEYEVTFAADKAEFRRRDGEVHTQLEVALSPEDGTETWRIRLSNTGDQPRIIEVLSYGEVVLLPHEADVAHPAFGKLFVETEYLVDEQALIFRRRPREAKQDAVWLMHVVAGDGLGKVVPEVDRERFLGRGRGVDHPLALNQSPESGLPLGPTLDPIFSLRCRVVVPPSGAAVLAYSTTVARSRAEALRKADQYHDLHSVARLFELAWAHSQVELRNLRVSSAEVQLFQRMAGHLLFAQPDFRAAPATVLANRLGLESLWSQGLSGDIPVLVLLIGQSEHLPFVRQLLDAHWFWRHRGLEVDLVLLNQQPGGYYQELQGEINRLIHASEDRVFLDQRGGVHVRQAEHLPAGQVDALLAAARCVVDPQRGPLAEQLERLDHLPTGVDLPSSTSRLQPKAATADPSAAKPMPTWRLDEEGRVFEVELPADPAASLPALLPPAPWLNVIANPHFGFTVSEAGSVFTWAGNSQTNRLTPWSNDPVTDPSGEVIYVRDEETREVWTPTALPAGGCTPCRARHAPGTTTIEQSRDGLQQEVRYCLHREEAAKVTEVILTNNGKDPRRLTVTCYVEWVLGRYRERTHQHLITQMETGHKAVLVWNPFSQDYDQQLAFLCTDGDLASFTADRREFIGRLGTLASPAGLRAERLAGTVGVNLDSCAALQVRIQLAPGETGRVRFFLGWGESEEAGRRQLARCLGHDWPAEARTGSQDQWDAVLGAVQIHTPDVELNALFNHWLLTQVLSCRMWGRTALYQSSGAFGFRDQLQDCLALVHALPGEARTHLLRAAGRQFVEGDVQHWWHPPRGAGVRTRITDDLLWLPYAVCRYAEIAGDQSIWDEQVPFLDAPLLAPGQEDDYRVPAVSSEVASVYEHCHRAVVHACRFGAHGLPLMGAGDWNDGMNRVGLEGQGESVWNGWFLHSILRDLAQVATDRREAATAERLRQQAAKLLSDLEQHAWDGEWYRRAYFDDGKPLGSVKNAECRIDSLPQSWAVISGAADPDRARRALGAAEKQLLSEERGLVRLFTPPFSGEGLAPGYVAGYLPGIRENGGQYTHAAIWMVKALARLGNGTRAVELLRMLNPLVRYQDARWAANYRLEPYVVAADIAGASPHTGRGGWSWYTGSSAWFYRVVLEDILGFQRRGNQLRITPALPAHWKQCEIRYRFGTTTYIIRIHNHAFVDGPQKRPSCSRVRVGEAFTLQSEGGEVAVNVYAK